MEVGSHVEGSNLADNGDLKFWWCLYNIECYKYHPVILLLQIISVLIIRSLNNTQDRLVLKHK